MMHVDVNVLLGHWPFRKIRKNSLDDLRNVHRKNGISGGYAASLNSIFYNDPFEGDAELHEWIRGTEYKHVLTVNPTLPGWERDIREGISRFDIHGVRIYPTYHDYKLGSEPVERLCDTLRKLRLPLFVTKRMEDERLDYLIKPAPLTVDELKTFVRRHADLDIVLLNIRFGEIVSMSEEINKLPKLYLDTSGLKDRAFVIEELLQQIPAGKIMYGSQHPLYCLQSTHCLIDFAEVDETVKQGILGGNASFLASRAT